MKAQPGFEKMIGSSPAMEKLYRTITKIAARSHGVLILGESGTGKELVARAIHRNGANADKPFVAVDCGALAPTLVESELFGYAQGAFTGAVRSKEGLLQAAEGGTIFLDEVGELSLEVQAKLLRALQEKEVRPVGSAKTVAFNGRVIAATNRDLEDAVARGQFRKDLYYRLAVVVLKVPPLRDRREDIPLLANHFVEVSAPDPGFDRTILPEAMDRLMAYDWPGNVRELANCMERAVALNTNGPIRKEDLPTSVQAWHRSASQTQQSKEVVSMAELERRAIRHALEQAKNNKFEAARLLGIGKTTLYRKLKEFGETGN